MWASKKLLCAEALARRSMKTTHGKFMNEYFCYFSYFLGAAINYHVSQLQFVSLAYTRQKKIIDVHGETEKKMNKQLRRRKKSLNETLRWFMDSNLTVETSFSFIKLHERSTSMQPHYITTHMVRTYIQISRNELLRCTCKCCLINSCVLA